MHGAANPLAATVGELQRRSREKRRADALACPQLPLWPEGVRSAPNEILRSALFTARNQNQPREMFRQASIAVIGDGRITYTGEELRQEDETVWLQLVHLAKHQPLGQPVEFKPRRFLESIGWSICGQNYDRLLKCLTRLQATALAVYSKRLGEGVSLSMIPLFRWKDEATDEKLAIWQVRVAPELVLLFADMEFTWVEWKQRLELPKGLAQWLHGYLASHRTPYPIRIETIRIGAGLRDDTPGELRRGVEKALAALKKVGFLADYEIKDGVVRVERARRECWPKRRFRVQPKNQ